MFVGVARCLLCVVGFVLDGVRCVYCLGFGLDWSLIVVCRCFVCCLLLGDCCLLVVAWCFKFVVSWFVVGVVRLFVVGWL